MSQQLTTSRSARDRRLVAVAIWLGLAAVAMVFWNTRTQRIEIVNPSETVAFLLAAFTTFVSLFAWMLFNPARGVSAETPTLMLAGMATLLPPCVIAFCTMPPGSPLSGWLTAGLFLLLVIAVMSPVPDEFFGIPRSRRSYLQSFTSLEIPQQQIVDPQSDWLRSTDFPSAMIDSARPSLAPRTWRDGDQILPRGRRRRIDSEEEDRQRQSGSKVAEQPARRRRGFFRQQPDSTPQVDAPSERGPAKSRQRSRPAASVAIPVADPSTHDDRQVADTLPRLDDRKFQRAAPTPRPTDADHDTPSDPFDREAAPPAGIRTMPLAEVSAPTHERDDIQIAGHTGNDSFERIQDDRGGEMVEGTVRIHFARGQRRANVHVPFSPPLAGSPDVECGAVDHDAVRVKAAERRAWGIRIEGRRTETTRVEDVDVAFSAVYVPAQ